MDRVAGVIRTPDERLRVFVSSTLRELATERRAARAAIERLALAPVMFELGARPHPPRSLYRAYLDQSDIFVGLYWEQYGWIAPGEEVSGLEDEYDLASDIPMLIYMKRSDHRQERLEALLDRIRKDDRASYVSFDNADELTTLLTTDLATLLAERFAAGDRRRAPRADVLTNPSSTEIVRPPTPLTRMIGRDDELADIVQMLSIEQRRLVTLTGPGGIGKSRLAIAAAREVEQSFPDGVAFVDLAPVRDPDLVLTTIASALGIRDSGDVPLFAKVKRALDGRRVLLVLDNMEQVVGAAGEISALLSGSTASVLATSRTLLRIEGERSVALRSLAPRAAIELFVERARAVKPDFELTEDNARDIAAICAALDNAPLALELAAARIRVLTPAELARRLDRALTLLVDGARDRPERQQSLRSTIEWSTQLLGDDERQLLLRLGVFRRGFGLDAVEWMNEGLNGADAVSALAALIDSSLVREQDRGSRAWFTMLGVVREYARDELEAHGSLLECRDRHATFYARLTVKAEPELISPEQSLWMSRLVDELDEIRATIDYFSETGRRDAIAELVWPLYWFWWARGLPSEVVGWMTQLLRPGVELQERTRFRAEFYEAGFGVWKGHDLSGLPALQRCMEFFRHDGDPFGELLSLTALAFCELLKSPPEIDGAQRILRQCEELADQLKNPFLVAMVLQMRGQATLMSGDIPAAVQQFERSLAATRQSGEIVSQSNALNHLGWASLLSEKPEMSLNYFKQQVAISSAVGHEEGVAFGLEGLFAVAATSGDIDRAGRLLGAADDVRERKGVLLSMFSYHEPILNEVLAGPSATALDEGRAAGRKAGLAAIVEEALA
ncbi:DUF4062 domain-containing protein [Agromyces sp. NPDC058484]|uniref:DUF4062 domain-containing protein n=1 Tax=Agromyces sp. NPDC058484 TaxID=3346524 RepID=UPI003651FC24